MQSLYCFGCQRGGDVIRFQQLIEKTDFKGALDALAEMAGVERKQESGAQKERTALRRRIVELNRLGQPYYASSHTHLRRPTIPYVAVSTVFTSATINQ